MITKDNVFRIAKLQKSHGIKGEIAIVYDKAEYADIDVDFYFMDLDAIFVPFRIEEINFMGDTRGRVKFEDIDDEISASRYSNIDIYILKKEMAELDEEEIPHWGWFIGYQIVDQDKNTIGEIEAVDDSTINTLFIVVKGDEEHLIPANEDFFIDVDEENKIIHLNLPEGLI